MNGWLIEDNWVFRNDEKRGDTDEIQVTMANGERPDQSDACNKQAEVIHRMLQEGKLSDREDIRQSVLASKSNMFATFDTVDDLIAKYNLKGDQIAIVMMAVNTTLQQIADNI